MKITEKEVKKPVDVEKVLEITEDEMADILANECHNVLDEGMEDDDVSLSEVLFVTHIVTVFSKHIMKTLFDNDTNDKKED